MFLLVVAGQDLRHLGRYDPKDSYCGMCKAGFTGYAAPCAVFVFLVLRAMVLGIMAGMVQKDICNGMCKAGFTGYAAPCAVFVFLVLRAMVLGIMAGMVQKDICSGMCKAGFTGYAALRTVFFVVVRPRCSASWPVWNRLTVTQWAGFLDNAPRAVFLGLQAHDARNHGRYEPEGQSRSGAFGQTAENCGVSAVAVYRWSSISLSRCRGSLSWSRQFVRP